MAKRLLWLRVQVLPGLQKDNNLDKSRKKFPANSE